MMGELRFCFGRQETRLRFVSRPETGVSAGRAVSLFDVNTHRLFGAGAEAPVIVPAGESAKCWPNVETLLSSALQHEMGRDDAIIGVGGGVVCDLAAFAASIYMRGCRLILVPTTLLAMVDASLGGKTGINFSGYKNLVGTFYPAEEIRLSVSALDTLPSREFNAGLAEVIKTGMLGDPDLLRLLEENQRAVSGRSPELMEEIVRRCLTVKNDIVAADPLEGDRRAVLNLGHTFAHALESAGGLESWNHGEAVAWGLYHALAFGVKLGVTRRTYYLRVVRLLSAYGFKTNDLSVSLSGGAGETAARLVEAMRADKKKRGGGLRLVLQRDLGDTLIETVDPELVESYLRSG
jgi:3-dehydroquinate synthase